VLPKTILRRRSAFMSSCAITRIRWCSSYLNFSHLTHQKWTVDFATWRPLEEKNRDLPIHKRNDLLHVDAFHSRPTHGNRILRCFTNINPERSRVWATTAGFETLAERFALDAGLDQIARQAGSPLGSVKRGVGRLLKSVGVRGADRSAYDAFMLRFRRLSEGKHGLSAKVG